MLPSPPSYLDARYASLANRGVVITGGASGIGAEMVRGFAAQGARVDFLDIDIEASNALAANFPNVLFHHCDVMDIAALQATLASIEAQRGPIDVLINNAARDTRQALLDISPQDWRGALGVNLDHQFFASQSVAKFMQKRQTGCILLMGSVSWMRGRPGMAGYTTAKAAINGLNRTLARELGPDNIRVNCLVPGAILTERQSQLWLNPEINQQFIDLQALKFRLDASHVVRMALFLASDEASGCTGANFVVDAGLTAN